MARNKGGLNLPSYEAYMQSHPELGSDYTKNMYLEDMYENYGEDFINSSLDSKDNPASEWNKTAGSPGGGNVNVMGAISSGISLTAGLVTPGALGQDADTSAEEAAMKSIGDWDISKVNDYDTLQQLYQQSQAINTQFNWENWRPDGMQKIAGTFGDTLNGAMQGASFGGNFGGFGSAIGAAAGGLAYMTKSLIESELADQRAQKRATELHDLGEQRKADARRSIAAQSFNVMGNMKDTALLNIGAFGGHLHTGDFSNGVRFIDEGGSHEQNPYGGIPQGIALDGIQNLVEEGEVIYKDYVFSDRLKVPSADKEMLGLKKDKDYSFADAAELIQKESEERPNDPLSKANLDAMLGRLQGSQEYLKQKQEAQRFKREFNKLSPEEQLTLLAGIAGQQLKFGGHLFDDGGTMVDAVVQSYLGGDYDLRSRAAQEGQNYNYSFNLQVPGFISSESTVVTPEKVNLDLGNDEARTYYKDKNPEAYTYFLDRARRLRTQNTNPGIILPEILVNPRKKAKGGKLGHKYDDGGDMLPYEDWIKIFPNSGVTKEQYEAGLPDDWGMEPEVTVNAIPGETPKTKGISGGDIAGMGQFFRAAPILGSALGTISAFLDKPNFANIERAERKMNQVPYISPKPISNRLAYNPIDINYIATQLGNQSIGTRRAIQESTLGNRAAALNGILAAGYMGQTALADALIKARQANQEQKTKIEEFNRGTDIHNSQQAYEAARQNQLMDYHKANMFLTTGQLRDQEIAKVQANRSAQLTNLFQNIGNWGQDLVARGQVKTNADSGVYGTLSPEEKAMVARELGFGIGAKGGPLFTIKRKGGRHA